MISLPHAVRAGALLLPALLLGSLARAPIAPGEPAALANRYIGAAACKNCHKAKEKGEQFPKWEAAEHAKAWEDLASPKAKEVAEKLGVADPQKSPKCLKCHVTAFDKPKKDVKAGFKIEMGVQCESCHGPGEQHAKARFAAASAAGEPAEHVVIPEDEILARPKLETCKECHSEDSPTFKPFCFKERSEKIAHLDPRKKRSDEELAAKKCGCGEGCTCKQGECSAPAAGKDDKGK